MTNALTSLTFRCYPPDYLLRAFVPRDSSSSGHSQPFFWQAVEKNGFLSLLAHPIFAVKCRAALCLSQKGRQVSMPKLSRGTISRPYSGALNGAQFVNEANTGNRESCWQTSINEQECPKVMNTGRYVSLHTLGIKSKSEVWSECFLF